MSRAGLSASPTQLLDLLHQDGNVTELGRQGGGAKAVDRYQFAAAVPARLPGSSLCESGPSSASVSVTINLTGVAEVGVRSGKVGYLTYREPVIEPTGERPNMLQASSTNGIRVTVQMTDYGLPVVVKAPAHWN